MPVPKVKGSEDQNTFIGRCMSWANDEHPEMDRDQKVAMCMTAWRDSKGMTQPASKSRITKSYLEKVVRKVLNIMVTKATAQPVGTISERSDGRYKKVAPGQWEKVPKEKELTDEGDGEKRPAQDRPVMSEQGKELLSSAYNELVEMEDLKTSNKISDRLDDIKEKESPEESLKDLDMLLGAIEDGVFPGVDTSSPINTILLDLWSNYDEARRG